ncbi:alpha/beta fold hydrolase [Larkinella rosea]|uniref:Alpha/beta hydrolase n=1 Tax=Larkinella rosea TaxID=2025312 RepID=A0A3P1BZI7_9BACT|nr:alpha/beta hydrolase [Larkinella rosea]RRB06565.1 alpha/beta hydrolase [Larkinella rosea]
MIRYLDQDDLIKAILIALYALFSLVAKSQSPEKIPYGSNPKAGRYLQVDDARIYYEVYGQGKPVVLLHGGLLGYIDEFSDLITRLSKEYQVIAVATRGHGKSEVGTKPYTYRLFAEDARAVIKAVAKDSVILIGFSDGAISSYILAVDHPELVRKEVAIGGGVLGIGDYDESQKNFWTKLTDESLEKALPGFIAERKKQMPQPQQWSRFLSELQKAWLEPVYIDKAALKKIKCPTLIVAGDHDGSTERFVSIYKTIPNAQLAIIPGSGHVVLLQQPKLTYDVIHPFISH